MRHLVTVLAVCAAGACHRAPPVVPVGRAQACDGTLVLEFTNRRIEPVQVGWIPLERLQADSARAVPVWLGVLGRGTARYEVPGPGRVIFRTANPAGPDAGRHEVGYRLLCRAGRRS